ncbi:hypothetical protein HHI36_023702 [Cryptolaemus montrouzieri]|uniref:Uncharacterized protein n=1 Tax=Cryptolaemus montrouzieri TaxID=559131 RepID=A0ABD2PJP4_9CUCU
MRTPHIAHSKKFFDTTTEYILMYQNCMVSQEPEVIKPAVNAAQAVLADTLESLHHNIKGLRDRVKENPNTQRGIRKASHIYDIPVTPTYEVDTQTWPYRDDLKETDLIKALRKIIEARDKEISELKKAIAVGPVPMPKKGDQTMVLVSHKLPEGVVGTQWIMTGEQNPQECGHEYHVVSSLPVSIGAPYWGVLAEVPEEEVRKVWKDFEGPVWLLGQETARSWSDVVAGTINRPKLMASQVKSLPAAETTRLRKSALIIPKVEEGYAATLKNFKKQLKNLVILKPIQTIRETRNGAFIVGVKGGSDQALKPTEGVDFMLISEPNRANGMKAILELCLDVSIVALRGHDSHDVASDAGIVRVRVGNMEVMLSCPKHV